MKKDIVIIAEHFGMKHQSIKTREELGELIYALDALSKEFTVKGYENLVEEVGDVENMLDQVKYFYEIPEKEILEIRKMKIERTIERNQIDDK